MDKLSNRLDLVDKTMDIRNYYLECRKHAIINEINWLAQNLDRPDDLYAYFSNSLLSRGIVQISSAELRQLAEIHGNYLYLQLCGLEQQKVDNTPLKVIVQELKSFGQ